MREAIKRYSHEEIIDALKSVADQWIVVEKDGQRWFCDGRAIIACSCKPNVTEIVPTSAEKWEHGIFDLLGRSREKYSIAERGEMCGGFAIGYMRVLKGYEDVYQQERYVRAAGDDAEAHTAGPMDRVYYLRDGKITAVIMPIRNKGVLDGLFLANVPAVPFVEDAVLFHQCPESEEFEF